MNSNLPVGIIDHNSQGQLMITAQPLSEAQAEEIKRRLQELLELALQGMQESTEGDTAGMLAAMGPLFLMAVQEQSSRTLTALLICFGRIVQAVLDLACSQPEYEAAVEPLLRQFIELQKELK